jgi:PPM family protein phosphatase
MITYSGATTKGRIREKNEDAFLIASKNDGLPYIFAVADGIGGSCAGEVASRTAVTILEERFLLEDLLCYDIDRITKVFAGITKDINTRLNYMSDNEEDKRGLGTTLSVMLLYKEKAVIFHVGDSSVFRIKDKVYKLTEDHTFVNELLKKNEISESEAKKHPKRNIITKALGCGFEFETEVLEIEVEEDDIFILCTDGLFSSGEDHSRILDDKKLRQMEAGQITSYLISYADNAGGRDNTTIITIRI